MLKKKFSNIEIIQAIKSNKADLVLRYFYKNLEPKIRRWIMQNRGSKQEAQDIFQDSIVAFYSCVMKDKVDAKANFDAFIFRISKNNWINYVKKQNRSVELNESIQIIKDDNLYISPSKEKEQLIAQLLEQLGEVCKEILTYTIFYNISMEDVCTRLGFKNPNTAKTKNYKCKQRLKNLLIENPQLKKTLMR